MDNMILCTFNLFDLHQQIQLVDENEVRVIGISSIDDLGENIAMLCDKYDVHNVHLYGSTTYAHNLIQQMIDANVSKYNNRAIDVEIN